PAAWDTTQGSSSVIIAVVDTGIDANHPDLAAKIAGQKSIIGGGVGDAFRHGTPVAGKAPALTHNATRVPAGCPNCKLLNGRVLDSSGKGFTSDIATGITYAADFGARVINMSLGGNDPDQTMPLALAYAVSKGTLPVCAMGNGGTTYPEYEPSR